MVFSSIQGYVDPPNWHHQQPNHHQANGSDNTQLLPPLPPQVGGSTGGGGTMGSIRPGSMADRARLAKLPPPEPALKCPRCDSTNTKFCYFNNYSLTQPRHFCKTCRRYWTRGGALRNVPVGGGCRRNNKKNKRSRSKSPSSTNSQEKQTSSSSTIPSHHELIGHQLPQTIPNLPFMASMQNLSRYVVGNVNMGLGLREIQEQQQHQQQDHMGFQIGIGNGNTTSVSVSASAIAGGVGVEPWRNLQQFPFLNTFESNSSGNNPYTFQGESNIEAAAASGFVGDIASNSRVNQEPPVKMEENRALNLSRTSLGVSEHNNQQQYYSWNDLSGSSTTHLL